MATNVELIKELRDMTSASIADCKQALHDSGNDLKKAAHLLRQRGLEIASKKQGRAAKEGRVESYVHFGNKIGVLLEVDCETDFVARNDEFAQFTRDIAMHIAASSPVYIKREDVPQEELGKEKHPEQFLKERCLLEQPFVKDPGTAVKDYLGSLVAKFQENIFIRRFERYRIGE